MNKEELTKTIADKTGFGLSDTYKFLDALIEITEGAVMNGDKIRIREFGTLGVGLRKSRTGRNVVTGESMKIPSSKVPVFKPSTRLKALANADCNDA